MKRWLVPRPSSIGIKGETLYVKLAGRFGLPLWNIAADLAINDQVAGSSFLFTTKVRSDS